MIITEGHESYYGGLSRLATQEVRKVVLGVALGC